MPLYYRIQPAGLGIKGHQSESSASSQPDYEGEDPYGIDVFSSADQVMSSDSWSALDPTDEVLVIEADEDWDNEDVEGCRIDPETATIVDRITLDDWPSYAAMIDMRGVSEKSHVPTRVATLARRAVAERRSDHGGGYSGMVMSPASDRRRWDELHAAHALARTAVDDYEGQLAPKYGWSQSWRSWITKTERDKLDRLEARRDKVGDKIVDLLVRVSPRGEAWLSGVPAWWIKEKLTWEDAVRPTNEPLSVEVPTSWGNTQRLTESTVEACTCRSSEVNDDSRTNHVLTLIARRDRRDWSQMPVGYERDAVKAAYQDIKPFFDQRDVSARIAASKAATFDELRQAVSRMQHID